MNNGSGTSCSEGSAIAGLVVATSCRAVGCGLPATLVMALTWRGGSLVQPICAGHELPLSALRRLVRGDVVVRLSPLDSVAGAQLLGLLPVGL